jgi:hypothetical protein|uniref:Recombination enhancement, RecA-dependent nuclease n=1 Tax=Myoviridae sp. ct5xZ3 TaxID=2827601 RepID=A0A8S5RRM7_9CAUD|nr:MAG TPA: Recombination enhancement, RecA-dependent nuclease [Myoviridae sp. ct5xZ3]
MSVLSENGDKMQGVVTEYKEICAICGRTTEAEHHLIFGTSDRNLAERDGIKIPICNNCHNMGQRSCRIHDNPMAEKLSKISGQLAWEKEWILNELIQDKNQRKKIKREAREKFRERYRQSFL